MSVFFANCVQFMFHCIKLILVSLHVQVPVSIVLVDYQEPFLVQTVHALLRTESSDYINEILIIDDLSVPAVGTVNTILKLRVITLIH